MAVGVFFQGAAIDLLIYDFDGVIADSEVLACQALRACLVAVGIEIDLPEVIERFVGRPASTSLNFALARTGRPLPTFAQDVAQHTAWTLTGGLTAVPGAIEFIRRNSGKRQHIASSSSRARLRLCLHKLGLNDQFEDAVTSSEEVAHGKPAPDVFLRAAALRGVRPDRCLVIEDSEAGVTGALAAGMHVIGLCAGAHMTAQAKARLQRAGAHHVADGYDDIERLLR